MIYKKKEDKEDVVERFINKMGSDLLQDIKSAVPKHLETIIEQRFKGIRNALEGLDRIEAEQKAQGKDIETLMISYKKLEQNYADLTINSKELPKEIKKTITEDNKELAEAFATDLENLSERKSKSLLRFFRRKK